MALSLGLGLGFARRGGVSAAQRIRDLADAAGAQAIWNADDPSTWTLRESGGTSFYSATADKLGALPDLTQSTEANQPDQLTLSTGARVWARTGGSARRMESTSFTEISQPNTLLIVFRAALALSGQRIFDPEGIGAARQIAAVRSDGGVFKFGMWAGTWLHGTEDDNLWHIAHYNFNSTSSEMFFDGTSVGTGDAGTNGLDAAAIMSRTTFSDPMIDGGRVALVIIFPSLKTNASLADLRAAINDRYPIGESE